jgi:hypothetical protein
VVLAPLFGRHCVLRWELATSIDGVALLVRTGRFADLGDPLNELGMGVSSLALLDPTLDRLYPSPGIVDPPHHQSNPSLGARLCKLLQPK